MQRSDLVNSGAEPCANEGRGGGAWACPEMATAQGGGALLPTRAAPAVPAPPPALPAAPARPQRPGPPRPEGPQAANEGREAGDEVGEPSSSSERQVAIGCPTVDAAAAQQHITHHTAHSTQHTAHSTHTACANSFWQLQTSKHPLSVCLPAPPCPIATLVPAGGVGPVSFFLPLIASRRKAPIRIRRPPSAGRRCLTANSTLDRHVSAFSAQCDRGGERVCVCASPAGRSSRSTSKPKQYPSNIWIIRMSHVVDEVLQGIKLGIGQSP